MNFETYLEEAPKTLSPEANTIDHFIEGINEEGSELLGIIKKRHYGLTLEEIDRVHVVEELGDLCWYIVNLQLWYLDFNEYSRKVFQEIFGVDAPFWKISIEERLLKPFTMENLVICFRRLALDCSDCLQLLEYTEVYVTYDDEEGNHPLIEILNLLPQIMTVMMAIMNFWDIEWEEVFEANINKLHKKRYKNGFSKEAALNRNLSAEREELEASTKSPKLNNPNPTGLSFTESHIPKHHE